jgi:DNA-nicking Smr family endonuclease
MPTDYDQWPPFKFLAQEVADQLTARRGEPWTVAEFHEDHAHPACTLAGPDHARIYMQHGFDAAGKVTVKGMWPGGYTHGAPSRNVNPARGARAIAQEIGTHILYGGGYGYLARLPEKLAEHEAAQARQRLQAEIMGRFAELVDTDPPEGRTLDLSPLLPARRGEVSVHVHDEPPTASLELHGLDVGTAAALLAVFARSAQANGRCCARFGPGHDERLSLLGCQHADRTDPPTWEEGDALYSLYLRTAQETPWPQWLGATDVHAAWR